MTPSPTPQPAKRPQHPILTLAETKRFWSHVDQMGEHWIWNGYASLGGNLPFFRLDDGTWYLARSIAYQLTRIPGTFRVSRTDSTCQHNLCVNSACWYTLEDLFTHYHPPVKKDTK